MEKNFPVIFNPVLEDADFTRISRFIYEECGIRLPVNKKVMVEARLQKRLRDLKILTYAEYLKMIFDSGKMHPEVVNMIDVITTNKTDFFREANHFQFLREVALPEYYSSKSYGTFRVWSAGCSSGEEVYTLAMLLNEFTITNHGFDYDILGTDLSTRMLELAKTAIYPEAKAAPIPPLLKSRYLLKSKNRSEGMIRIVPELRKKVHFEYMNLITGNPYFEPFDSIFCRNVLIYFDRETQLKVISKLAGILKKDCYLFIGHSESIMNHDLPLLQVAPSVYKKL